MCPKNGCFVYHAMLYFFHVPTEVLSDLSVASQSAVLPHTDSLRLVNGSFSLPRLLAQEMLEVVDTCIEGTPYIASDEVNLQARGLGTMVAFWERMGNICPKVNIYHGPILQKDGSPCLTSCDLRWSHACHSRFLVWTSCPRRYPVDACVRLLPNCWTLACNVAAWQRDFPLYPPARQGLCPWTWWYTLLCVAFTSWS